MLVSVESSIGVPTWSYMNIYKGVYRSTFTDYKHVHEDTYGVFTRAIAASMKTSIEVSTWPCRSIYKELYNYVWARLHDPI